jgi:hypothetical protein
MVHWKLKACPRCGGDIFIDRDLESWFEQCLQCSHWRELPDVAPVVEQPVGANTVGANAEE